MTTAIAVTRLTPCFAARIEGVDVSRPVDDATWPEIRAAFEEHSVLVFPGQPLDDDLWHSDSSFKPVPSLCSLLSARIIPPEGGATEFASARAAYPSLPEALKARVEHAVAVHDFSWSRDQVP